ncbi:hypothetical protein ACHAWF_018586 [Thalassiosira exigua]
MMDWHHGVHEGQDYHELPEFLRFNRYGGVLTTEERQHVAKTKGVCCTCGAVTHKVTPFRSVPLDNRVVCRGVCLRCHPNRRGEVALVEPPPVAASGKAAKILGGHENGADAAKGKKGAKHFRERMRRATTEKKPIGLEQLSGPPRMSSDQTGRVNRGLRATYAGQPMRSDSKPGRHNARLIQSDDGGTQTSPDKLGESDPQHVMKRASLLDMHKQFHSSPDGLPLASPSRRGMGDAWDIIKAMRSHRDDVELLRIKCDELRNLGQDYQVQGSIYEIIEVMQRFPTDRPLQIAAIGALWSLSDDGVDDTNMEVIDAGGADAIMEVMERFPRDLTVLSWGLGALGHLGEGADGRVDLEEKGVVSLIETILKLCCEETGWIEVLYWAFRCLLQLIYDHSDPQSANGNIDPKGAEEELIALERIRTAIADSEIGHFALLALDTVPLGDVTLEMAFMCLSHFNVADCLDLDRTFLLGACNRAMEAKPSTSFPLLHHLACATLCQTMGMDSSSDYEECQSASDFAIVALSSLTSNQRRHSNMTSSRSRSSSITSIETPPYPFAREVMVCTLSHLLYFDNKWGVAESERALRICCTLLAETDESSIFLQSSCCWIIWSMLFHGASLVKDTASSLNAAEAICHVMKNIERNPVVLTIAFSSLSELVGSDLHAIPLVERVVPLISKYANVESLCQEACRLLFKVCQTNAVAHCILSAGFVDATKKCLDGSERQCRITFHLLVKLSVLADGMVAPEAFDAAMHSCAKLKTSSPLAAKAWLRFLTRSLSPAGSDLTHRLPMATNSIKEIMAAFDGDVTGEHLDEPIREVQRCACMAVRNIAVVAQRAESPLDVSACVKLVLAMHKKHGIRIRKESCNALWALTGVQTQLEPSLIKEILYATIEAMEVHVVAGEHAFSDDILLAGMAIFANTLNGSAVNDLGEKVVDTVVDVVIATLFSYLDKRASLPSLFHFAFCLLGQLCDDKLTRDIIVDHGGIVAVVDGMGANENLDDPSARALIQESGCNILKQLACHDLETKLKIVEADAVDVIMSVIISHSEHEGVLSKAFRALSSLSVDSASRYFIAQQGGIMLISNAIDNLSQSVAVQETGLVALCILASDAKEDILTGSNIFSVVTDSLKDHAENAAIQRNGLALLYNLSLRSSRIKNQLFSSGCFAIITKAIEAHTNCSKIITPALRAMANLLSQGNDQYPQHKNGMQYLLNEDVLNLIVNAMMVNVKNLRISMVCCTLLSHDPNKISTEGVEAIVCSMLFHHSSECVTGLGCRLLSISPLHSFISNDVFDADFFELSCKVVEVLLNAMSGFPENFEIQFNSIVALERMSKHGNNGKEFSADDINIAILVTEQTRIELLLKRAMERFPELRHSSRKVLKVIT